MVANGLRSAMSICPSIVPELRPIPRISRPSLNWSSVAAELASKGADRTYGVVTLIPSCTRSVTAATYPSEPNASHE
jgi:hypothetical protein